MNNENSLLFQKMLYCSECGTKRKIIDEKDVPDKDFVKQSLEINKGLNTIFVYCDKCKEYASLSLGGKF